MREILSCPKCEGKCKIKHLTYGYEHFFLVQCENSDKCLYFGKPCKTVENAIEKHNKSIKNNKKIVNLEITLEKQTKRADDNEKQLIDICKVFGGKDARHVIDKDKSVAGMVKQEVERLRKIIAFAHVEAVNLEAMLREES